MKRIYIEDISEYRIYGSNPNDSINDIIAFTLTPKEDGWDKVHYYCKKWLSSGWGYIYILNNSDFPNKLKIGFTTKSPIERLKEINSATGVLNPYNLSYVYKCKNPYGLEQEIHKELENMGLRPNRRREGFVIKFDTAIEVVEWLGKKYEGSRVDWVN